MKKTITLLAIAITFIGMNLNAQPNWGWAKSAGGSAGEQGIGIWADASGNTYVTGTFASPSITFGTTTFSNGGGLDYFLVKYDPSGNVLWAKSATGNNNDVGYNVTGDGNGNIYVVGTTNTSSLTFSTTTLTLHGYDDIFVLKYDASGNLLWAKNAGGGANDIGQSIGVDGNGNAYITGYFASSSITFGSTTLTNSGGNDMYVVKYDPSGNVVWAKSAGGSLNDAGGGIAVDANGNSYITGSFSSSSISFGSTTFNNGGGIDYFTAKYDASGNVLWAKSATGNNNDVGYGIKVDGAGNSFVVGTTNTNSLTFSTTTLTLHGYDDIFVLKYDASGNLLWAKNAGGGGNDIGQSISIDPYGDSYITGYFASSSIGFGSTTLTNAGTDDIYVAAYDPSGNVMWAESVGGSGSDRGGAIATDGIGNPYLTGFFASTSISFGSTTLTNVGGNDMFVAKVLTNAVGVAEENNPYAIMTIFPDPNNGLFELQMNGIQNQNSDAQVSIVDMSGREVYHSGFNTQNSTNRIDLSNEPDGIYCVIVNSGNKQYTSRVMINR